MSLDTLSIRNAQGERIDSTYHPGAAGAPLVVIGHGVTGNKDRPLVVALAEGLAAAGVSALRFSFAGNGGSEGDFRDATITKEVGDLGAVLDAAEAAGAGPIVYAGHSMGGGVGVARAAAPDPRIAALISLAGMVETKKFAETEFGEVTPGEGFMWDDEDCPLSAAFMDDLRSIGSLEDRGAQISVPWLLVHGTEDDVVLIDDTHAIYERAAGPKQKLVLDGADHVFSDPGQMAAMVEGAVDWVRGLGLGA